MGSNRSFSASEPARIFFKSQVMPVQFSPTEAIKRDQRQAACFASQVKPARHRQTSLAIRRPVRVPHDVARANSHDGPGTRRARPMPDKWHGDGLHGVESASELV